MTSFREPTIKAAEEFVTWAALKRLKLTKKNHKNQKQTKHNP